MDVFTPWTGHTLDGSPSAFLTTSRSEVKFLQRPQRPLETCVVIAVASLGARLCDLLLLRCRGSSRAAQGRKVAYAPEVGGTGRGGAWALPWEACALTRGPELQEPAGHARVPSTHGLALCSHRKP